MLYYYDGMRVVEEQVDAGSGPTPMRQYVDGNGIDEHLQLLRVQNRKAYWYHEDAKGWVAAITKPNGKLEERRVYDTYGTEEIQDGSGTVQGQRFGPNLYGYQGRRLDPETGWIHFRARQYDPVRGRFVTRDPLGIWSDLASRGNGYPFAGNSPVLLRDPTGERTLAECEACCADVVRGTRGTYDSIVDAWENCDWWASFGMVTIAVGGTTGGGLAGGAAAAGKAGVKAGAKKALPGAFIASGTGAIFYGIGAKAKCASDRDNAFAAAEKACADALAKCTYTHEHTDELAWRVGEVVEEPCPCASTINCKDYFSGLWAQDQADQEAGEAEKAKNDMKAPFRWVGHKWDAASEGVKNWWKSLPSPFPK